MKISLSIIRSMFICLSILFSTTYTTHTLPGGLNFTNVVIGAAVGLTFSALLILSDLFLKKANLRTLTTSLLGLFIGYLLGESILIVLDNALSLSNVHMNFETTSLFRTATFLATVYFGMILTVRAAERIYISIPFVRFKAANPSKKDILMDWTILLESRIIELATSGLLDESIIVPRFMLKELYVMAENTDEIIKNKARRGLEVFKKLEGMTALELRYSDIDFPELSDSSTKLLQLARELDANIITSDISRFQHGTFEGIRIINIHVLSNALKPINGEQLSIKIQRLGKEPRQGVGYLEDGTMVVVNGGAEFIGFTIKAHVLSMKHTNSGRMIFCNVADESDNGFTSHVTADLDAKSYLSSL